MKAFGHVQPGSKEWTLQRMRAEKVNMTRASLEIMQAELAALKDVLKEARSMAAWGSMDCMHCGEINTFGMPALSSAIARYDGWLEDPTVRDDLIHSLLSIAGDLEGHDLQDGGLDHEGEVHVGEGSPAPTPGSE